MTNVPWNVEFFRRKDLDGTTKELLLDEIRDELTEKQFAVVAKNIARLERHGRSLDGTFFSRVQGVNIPLWEFRLSLPDRVEFRLLFVQEQSTFRMLVAYKEKRNDIPSGKLKSALARAKSWETQ